MIDESRLRRMDKRISELADNVLQKNNTAPFVPDADYEPATKAYADTKTPLDGWIPATAWTYVSATFFTVDGDQTSKYEKGNPLMWTQNGTVRYSNVISSAYDAGTNKTTITIHAGYNASAGDNAILNTATYPITNNFYSKAQNPQGFPGWFNWNPTYTGFSSAPTGGHRFKLNGRECILKVSPSIGTSNASVFTMSLPIPTADNGMSTQGDTRVLNGAFVSEEPGLAEAGANSSTLNLYSTLGGGSWNTSGNKRAQFTFIYEI